MAQSSTPKHSRRGCAGSLPDEHGQGESDYSQQMTDSASMQRLGRQLPAVAAAAMAGLLDRAPANILNNIEGGR